MLVNAKILAEAAPFLPKLIRLRNMVCKPVAELGAEFFKSEEPVPFGLLGDKVFKSINIGDKWGDFFDCAWFKFSGTVPENCRGKHIVAVVDIDGEGCVFDNDGNPVQGLTSLTGGTDLFQPVAAKKVVDLISYSQGGERVNLILEAGNNGWGGRSTGAAKLKRAEICEVNDEVKTFYYDYVTLFMLYLSRGKYDIRKTELGEALKEAYKLAVSDGGVRFSEAKDLVSYELTEPSDLRRFTIYTTGHAHLDLAWLWPLRETKRKAARTFSAAIKNIEKYDGYVFGASQPQQFDWMKKLYPKLYEEIKKAVANGRIEPQGGMWVESDTNIPCGESLIRQIYYGKKFFKDEFGADMKILWLPDVFGFSAQLPQIIKKSGMEYFLTIKLTWNEHNKFPLNSFMWEGIDDSAVLAHIPPEGTYNSEVSPMAVMKAFVQYKDKDRAPVAHMPYGVGDGGGGPNEIHLEFLKRLKKEGGVRGLPIIKEDKAERFFEDLAQYKGNLRTYKGELYLEKHQGTLTTQALNKYYNRKAETLLHNVEFLAAAAKDCGYKMPKERIEEIWKEVLLYQFHDIIPGSSIRRVYAECKTGYEKLLASLHDIQNDIIKFLSGKNQDDEKEDGKYAVNPTSYTRNEYVKHDGEWFSAEVMPYASAKLKPIEKNIEKSLKSTRSGLSNGKLNVTFAEAGYISSIKDASGREYVDKMFNRLVAYTDKKTTYNAWDIDIKYPNAAKYFFDAVSVDSYVDGAAAVRRTVYKFGRSTLTQKVILKAGEEHLLFETSVDWHARHKMLRADFYPAFFSKKATSDIQFGNIKRSTRNKTSEEYAQFETCAHKWVDVSDEKKGAGVSILNDCKYGHRIKDGLISLNLLRATTYPDPKADKGVHKFTYAVYPHEGGVFDGETSRLGYFINNPLIITEKSVKIKTSVLLNRANIVTETVKPSEDGKGIVLRLYENRGEKTVASIKTGFQYIRAYEADLMENEISDVNLNMVYFKPYEIKTLVLES
ncbi:MAG: glycosyl hydrolase-related protein [Clostridiales bacterium]|jgi:alpha-mannosidase|nr:glycosyl hydrolase-related protein [Clostridiales bacterium]